MKYDAASPRQQLTVFDCVCIIVGIIIGSGIYETTPLVAANVTSSRWLLFAWAVGGFVAIIGALCYAELVTHFPEHGGDYVFLTRAYHRRIGFLFVWIDFWIVRPANIGAMAFVFARYFREFQLPYVRDAGLATIAAVVIGVLAAMNLIGVRVGKWTQNVLAVIKVAGLVAIFVAAFLFLDPVEAAPASSATTANGSFRTAMIFVLFAYGGWHDVCYVAGEVRDPRRNMLRALLWGTSIVVIAYLLANLAFVRGLGFHGLQASPAVAAEVMERAGGTWGRRFISALICLSCLGAVNGMLFAGSRIYYSLGTKELPFRWLSHWNARTGTPMRSIVIQTFATVGLVLAYQGREDGFRRIVEFGAPFFWFFLCLTSVSLFVLRRQATPGSAAGFRVLFYPATPLLFCAACLFMFYSSATYLVSQQLSAGIDAVMIFGLLVVASGIATALLVRQRRQE